MIQINVEDYIKNFKDGAFTVEDYSKARELRKAYDSYLNGCDVVEAFKEYKSFYIQGDSDEEFIRRCINYNLKDVAVFSKRDMLASLRMHFVFSDIDVAIINTNGDENISIDIMLEYLFIKEIYTYKKVFVYLNFNIEEDICFISKHLNIYISKAYRMHVALINHVINNREREYKLYQKLYV